MTKKTVYKDDLDVNDKQYVNPVLIEEAKKLITKMVLAGDDNWSSVNGYIPPEGMTNDGVMKACVEIAGCAHFAAMYLFAIKNGHNIDEALSFANNRMFVLIESIKAGTMMSNILRKRMN